jgi:L-fucose mutarotase
MLKGLDPLLSPDLLWILAAMGHGDDLVFVDANHPAQRIAAATASGRLLRLPGVGMGRLARAILSVLPVDEAEPGPLRRMRVGEDPARLTAVQEEVIAAFAEVAPWALPAQPVERFAFYEAASRGFAVVQAGDARPYGRFLIRKGVIPA